MPLKMLVTADLHIGLRFDGYPEVAPQLRQARLDVLESMIARAEEESCDLLVIAGDLFQRSSMPKKETVAVAGLFQRLDKVLAVVLPGNHDHGPTDQSDLWRHFRDAAGDNTLLLEHPQPCPLSDRGLPVCLYPAPCQAKHSADNAIGWIRNAPRPEGHQFHIGLAHGTVQGLALDTDRRYYPMTVDELEASGLDLWLVGHTHVQFPARPTGHDRIFNPGTPEPDGMDFGGEGRAWLIELQDDRGVQATSIVTGRHRFIEEQVVLDGARALHALAGRYQEAFHRDAVVRLTLSGRLPKEHMVELGSVLDKLSERVLHLEVRTEVAEEITREQIDREYGQGSLPHRLLTALSTDTGDNEALQVAYTLIQEARR